MKNKAGITFVSHLRKKTSYNKGYNALPGVLASNENKESKSMSRMAPLNVKIPQELREKLQEKALDYEMSYSEYVRELLERRIDKDEQMSALFRLLSDKAQDSGTCSGSGTQTDNAILMEILLLVRLIAGTDKQTNAKTYMRMHGIEQWNGKIKS